MAFPLGVNEEEVPMRIVSPSIPVLAAVLVFFAQFPPESPGGEVSGEFAVLQGQIKKARDKVLPALVRVQPITEEFRGGRKVIRTGFGSGGKAETGKPQAR